MVYIMDLSSINVDLDTLLHSENSCEYTDVVDAHMDKISVSGRCALNIIHLNIRSFHKNSDSLVFLLNDLKERGITVHAIGLCETFLSVSTHVNADIENYQAIHRYRTTKSGGGVSILLHSSVKFKKSIDSPFGSSCESVIVEFGYNNLDVCMAEVYKPPFCDNVLFMQNLDIVVKSFSKTSLNVICTDQNFDL